MPDRDDRNYNGVPQAWSTSGNVPVVVVAPPASEPSVTRGVTGLFVPIFLGVFIIISIWFGYAAWQTNLALERQRAITREALGVNEYMRSIQDQNAVLCRDLALPRDVNTPPLVEQIAAARQTFDQQCADNNNFSGRFGGPGEGCTPATPSAGGAARLLDPGPPPRHETAQAARTRICARYGVTIP